MQEAPSAPEAPVALVNRRLARAFEPLSSLVGVPRYARSTRPPLLALAFPAFVGLMSATRARGRGARAAGHRAAPLADVAADGVAWPIGFLATVSTSRRHPCSGVVRDVGHRAFGIEPLWIDRAEATIPLLVLALSIGAVHVTLGLVLGVANAVLLRHRREAVGRAALLVGLAAMLLVVVSLADVVPAELAGPPWRWCSAALVGPSSRSASRVRSR